MDQKAKFQMSADAQLNAIGGLSADIVLRNRYRVVCRGAVKGRDGRWRRKCKWVEDVHNIVTTEGLNDLLTKYFKGSGYTAGWFVGLVDDTNFTAFAAGDTAAKITTTANPPTTNGWQEITAYDEAVRQTLTLGTASAGSINNSAAKAVFTINATKTVKGAFVGSSSTKGGTSGVLYGEASFSSSRAVVAADTITTTITLTAASA